MSDQQYDNCNRGVIWRNERKESDRHPDYKGNINIEGVDYWLSGWAKAADASPNAPLVKFSVQRKEETRPAQTLAQKDALAKEVDTSDADSLPF